MRHCRPGRASSGPGRRSGRGRGLAVGDVGSSGPSILLNGGAGVFGAGIRIPAVPVPTEVIAADLDGDGDADPSVWNTVLRTSPHLRSLHGDPVGARS